MTFYDYFMTITWGRLGGHVQCRILREEVLYFVCLLHLFDANPDYPAYPDFIPLLLL